MTAIAMATIESVLRPRRGAGLSGRDRRARDLRSLSRQRSSTSSVSRSTDTRFPTLFDSAAEGTSGLGANLPKQMADGRNPRGVQGARAAAIATAAIGAGRLAIGAGIWSAPRLAWRGLGFGEPAGAALVLGRLAATRDLALGAATLAAISDRRRLARMAAACAAVDAADALAFAFALRDAPELRDAATRGLAGAIPATVVGTWAAARLHRA